MLKRRYNSRKGVQAVIWQFMLEFPITGSCFCQDWTTLHGRFTLMLQNVEKSTVCLGARGGNQRELARQKNLKKAQEIHKGKRKEDSLSASQRKQRDSEIMQQKQKAANERKSLQAGAQ
ncbi:uncharacterized protein RG961_012975 isoform 1-T1 [Leptosomus discolor]